MAVKKDRLNTASVVASIVSGVQPAAAPSADSSAAPSKPAKEKKVVTAVYLPESMRDALADHAGRKKKEKDISALGYAAFSIIFDISNENYAKLKMLAAESGVTPGRYLNRILENK